MLNGASVGEQNVQDKRKNGMNNGMKYAKAIRMPQKVKKKGKQQAF